MPDSIPASFKPYFWDVDFDQLSLSETPNFILKRLLDLGDLNALKWTRAQFSDQAISQLVLSSRDLSEKTTNFWSKYLCLKRPYSQTPLTP